MRRTYQRVETSVEEVVHYETKGNPKEKEWTDRFGTHFECRLESKGVIFIRKITKTDLGWYPTWDQCRKSVMDAAS